MDALMFTIKLRKKPIAKGLKFSLFLDIHFKGQRYKDYLRLHIYAYPKDKLDREYNRQTLAKAEKIKKLRIKELKESMIVEKPTKRNMKFIDYFVEQHWKKESASSQKTWESALGTLLQIDWVHDILLIHVGYEELMMIRSYFLNEALSLKGQGRRISQNTAQTYFNKVLATMKEAFMEGILMTNLADRVERIKEQEVYKDYLTIDELHALAKTPMPYGDLKRACLFSALTGLRVGNIKKLQWQNVITNVSGQTYIQFEQVKRHNVQQNPLNEEAILLLGDRQSPEEPVFPSIKYSSWNNMRIKQWVMNAGIKKDITFHSFRHTYASNLYQTTGDIYLTQRLMGHKSIKTTLRYAKHSLEQSHQAMANFPSILKPKK